MAELPLKREKKVIEGGELEFETYLNKSELARFLRDLADQVEGGNEISINSEEWQIKSRFTEPVEVEVEFNGNAKKLKVELEFKERPGIKL